MAANSTGALLKPGDLGVGDASEHVGDTGLRIEIVEPALMISVAMKAARSAPQGPLKESREVPDFIVRKGT